VVENEFVESNVNESWTAGIIYQNDVVPRDIFTRSVIGCYSFAVISLLFRCYSPLFSLFFCTAGFKKPEFLRLSEVPSLYFAGLSAVSASEARLRSAWGGLSDMRDPLSTGLKPTPGSSPHQARTCNNP
jgi:hypothetical protein